MPSRRVPPAEQVTWWQRHRETWLHDLTVGLTAGAIISVPIAGATVFLDQRQAQRQERLEQERFDQAERLERERAGQQEVLENVRFVRDRAADGPGALKPFGGLNLRKAHLVGLPLGCTSDQRGGLQGGCADLRGADLRGADLTGADLTGTDLTGADLRYVDLTDAVLADANLTEASLIFASLFNAELSTAVLTDADLSAAVLSQANLHSAELNGAELNGAELNGTVFTNADLPESITDVCHDASTIWPKGFEPPVASQCAS